MKRIGILTGGGDAPGLNAVIHAAVKTAVNDYGCGVLGIKDGYDGFVEADGIIPLGMEEVRGTIVGAANQYNHRIGIRIRHFGNQQIVTLRHRQSRSVESFGLIFFFRNWLSSSV